MSIQKNDKMNLYFAADGLSDGFWLLHAGMIKDMQESGRDILSGKRRSGKSIRKPPRQKNENYLKNY